MSDMTICVSTFWSVSYTHLDVYKRQEYSDGTVGRSFSTDKYYYPLSFSGTTQSPAAATMTDFAVGTDTPVSYTHLAVKPVRTGAVRF